MVSALNLGRWAGCGLRLRMVYLHGTSLVMQHRSNARLHDVENDIYSDLKNACLSQSVEQHPSIPKLSGLRAQSSNHLRKRLRVVGLQFWRGLAIF